MSTLTMKAAAFTLETMAHLQGKEAEILPLAEAVRAGVDEIDRLKQLNAQLEITLRQLVKFVDSMGHNPTLTTAKTLVLAMDIAANKQN